VYLFQSFQ
jgi:hypothetical protein